MMLGLQVRAYHAGNVSDLASKYDHFTYNIRKRLHFVTLSAEVN